MSRLAMSLAVAAFLASAAFGGERMITTLDNGMTVAIEEDRNAPVAALRLYVRAGSLYEQEFMGAGISHFFEHLLAGGTTTRRSEEEAKALESSIGGQVNAYTTRDHTCYHINTLSRHFDTALELLSDWVVRHKFTPNEFQREKNVILEEMRNRSSDPNVQLYELMQRTAFKIHPVRFPVIGDRDLFLKITPEDLETYYRRMYVPNNIIFVAVGDFDAAEALEKIRAQFQDLKPGNVPVVALPSEPEQLGPRRDAREMDVAAAYLEMGFRTVPLSHPDLYALDVLSNILSHGDSSRLVQEIREKKRLVFSIHSWSYTPAYDAGMFSVKAVLAPDKLDDVREAVTEELERVKREAVSPAELAKAKKQVAASRYFDIQTAADRASDLGSNLLSALDPDFTRTYVARVQMVTPEEIMAVAQKYLRAERVCEALVRPAVGEQAAQRAREAEAGKIRKQVLSNGIRLLVKRHQRLPIVAVRAGFLAGVRAEQPENNGIGYFTAEMLTRGTATRSAVEIAQAFDGMGGSFSASSGNNSFYLSAQCLKEDLPKALEIVADCLMNPKFDPDEIEQVRRLMAAGLKRRHDNWHAVLFDAFRERFFQASPYRMIPEGSVDAVGKLRRADLAAYHQRYVVANNMVLSVFGDVEDDTAKELVERYFGAMRGDPKFEPPAPPREKPLERDSSAILRTQKRDLGTVFVAYSGMTVLDRRDRDVMEVIDAISSGIGIPRGWLHHALRGDRKGLVYEVHAFNMAGVDPGYFGAYAACKPENAETVAKLIRQEIARALTGPIDPKELDMAKEICITARRLGEQTNGEQAMQAMLDELYGLGYDASEGYAESIRSVTEEDIRRVADKYLRHSLTVIVLPPDKAKAEDGGA